MGRQNSDASMVVGSSIALLQERFRQLQREKEKREERDLLKLFSSGNSKQVSTTTSSFEPRKKLYQRHDDMKMLPSSALAQDALPLRLDSLSKPDSFNAINSQQLATASSTSNFSPNFGSNEVDTSLHL